MSAAKSDHGSQSAKHNANNRDDNGSDSDDLNNGGTPTPTPTPTPPPPPPPPAPPPPTPTPTPTSGGTALNVQSVSGTGFLAPGAATLPDVWGFNSGSLALGNTLQVSSTSSAVDPLNSNETVSTSQSVSATWTAPLSLTATINDSWSMANVTGADTMNANLNFGLGAPQGYGGVTFTFDLATAGTFDVNWNAVLGGSFTFGLQNAFIQVDSNPAISSSYSAVPIASTGDYVGALSAGTHTITINDGSNVSGFPGTGSGTLSETLALTITPSTSNVVAVNGLALSSMTFITPVSAGQSFTDTNGGHTLFQGSAANFSGDTLNNVLASDIIDITDMAFSSVALVVAASGGNTLVSLSANTTVGGVVQPSGLNTSFTVAGSYSQSSFHVASDGANGILISHS